MLSTSILISTPTDIGSGQYTCKLYFSPSSMAKYLNINDYIKDTANNEYQIITPTATPYTNGGVATVTYITNNVLPVADSSYTSKVYTPGQIDYRPVMRTAGTLSSVTLYSAPDYEYQLSGSWSISAEANKAIVGDSVVDASGKEFTITYLHPTSRFAVAFRVTEKERIGATPISGSATLFRPTEHNKFFQGTELSDPARNTIDRRDIAIIDDLLNSTPSGGSGSSLEDTLANSTGTSINAYTPVRSNSGNLGLLDVSNEAHAIAILGVTKTVIGSGSSGTIVFSGLIKNVTITGNFDDPVYVSKTGTLTTTKPNVGVEGFVAGDFCIYMGCIIKNQSNPIQKDLLITPHLVGQL